MDANGKQAASEPAGAPSTALIPRAPAGPPAGGPGDQNGAAQLRHILDALRRRWLLVAFLGLVAGGSAGAAVWYFVPTPYTATAELRVNPNTRFFWKTGEEQVRFEDYRDNLVYNAKSQMVILAALRGDSSPREATENQSGSGTSGTTASPQPPRDSIPQSGTSAAASSHSAKPQKRSLAQSRTLRDQMYPELWIERELSVSRVGTQHIRVSLSGEHPQDICDIVNAVVGALNEEIIVKEYNEKRRDLEVLNTVSLEKKAELERKRQELLALDKAIGAANDTQRDQNMLAQQNKYLLVQGLQAQMTMQRIKHEVDLAVLRDRDVAAPNTSSPPTEIPRHVVDSVLAEQPAYLQLLRAEHAKRQYVDALKSRLNPDNERAAQELDQEQQVLDALAAQLEEMRQQGLPTVRQRLMQGDNSEKINDPALLEQTIAELRKSEAEFEKQLAEIEVKGNQIANNSIDRAALAMAVSDLAGVVKQYDDGIYQREIELTHGKPPVEIAFAQTPKVPDQAKRIKMAGVAGLGLFGAVGALIVWLEMLTRKVNRVTDVEQELNLQLIGSVPAMPRFAMKGGDPGERSSKAAYWHSVLTESIDSARTLLLRYAKLRRLKTVMVASATGGEGKTSVSCHLATSLARAGRRVLLMDCDIRRPSIHWVFGLENGHGFCELLTGEATPDEAIHEASPPGLSILPAGRVNSEALRRLSQDDLGELIDQIGAGYDFVIIDTSPILPVTDALMFAQHVDGVLFSIRRDVSRMSKVQTAVQRLAMLGAPLLGAVAIGLNEGVYGTRYQYRHNGYGYGRHPSQDEPNGALAAGAAER